MKRANWYITLVLLMLVALTVNACAPVAPAPAEAPKEEPAAKPAAQEVVLKVMDNWGNQEDAKGPPLQSIFEDFMQAYPNIKIEEEVFSDMDIPTKVNTAFLAGEEPDLVFSNLFMETLDWLEDGVTIDVTNLIKEWGLEDEFKPEALAQWTDAQGRVQGFPLEGFTWPVWYNTKILEAAGVEIPKTTDELIAAAKKIRDAGYEPFATGGSDWTGQWDFSLIVSTMLTDEEVKQLYHEGGFSDNPNARAGIELFVKLRDEGVFVDDVEGLEFSTRNEKFYAGKAAMMHGGAWIFAECPDELKPYVVLGGFPLPPGSPHKKPIINAGYFAKAIWITRNGAEKLDAVEKFVKFFYQPEMIARFVEQAGMTSPLKDTPVDESKLDPLFVQSMKFGDDVEVAELIDLWIPPKAFDDVVRVFSEAYLPDTPAETIIANLDAVYEELD